MVVQIFLQILKNIAMKTSLMFLLGIGMGTVIGILIAPEAGKITRRKIRDEADRIVDQMMAKKKLKALEKRMAIPSKGDVSVIEEKYTI